MARSDWKRPAIVKVEEGWKRIKLTLSYDGSAYNGWQCQKNGVGVQDVLNEKLSEIYHSTVSVQGSGRTDSGVHALAQVCHYDVPINASKLLDERVSLALNAVLPPTIRILESERAPDDFHARFSTMAREYRYYVRKRNDALPFDEGHVGFYNSLPDINLLNEYARLIQGTHDFTTFASARDASEGKVRDIYVSRWDEIVDQFSRPLFCYTVVGNAFLYHQVRSMVGTMMCMALKERSCEDFKDILEAKDRKLALTTASASGLYLYRISYDEDEYLWFEEEVNE